MRESKTLSPAELLALERDAKRRQVKYKSVHTNRKTHTEIMKEVIDNQMASYCDWLSKKQEQTPQASNNDCDRDRLDTKKHKLKTEEGASNFSDRQSDISNDHLSRESRQEVSDGDYDIGAEKYRKHNHSPSEFSTASSSRSRKRYREDRHAYASSSRHSSAESHRSSNKNSETAGHYRKDYKEYDSRSERREYQSDKSPDGHYHPKRYYDYLDDSFDGGAESEGRNRRRSCRSRERSVGRRDYDRRSRRRDDRERYTQKERERNGESLESCDDYSRHHRSHSRKR